MALKGVDPSTMETYVKAPAGKPPPGEIVNYQDPPTLLPALVAITVISLVLSTSFVAMRIYTRQFILKRIWWDDYFSVLGWALIVAVTPIMFILEGHGGGVHQWNLHYIDIVKMSYWAVIAKAFYICDILIIKISILLQIKRIFIPTRHGNEFMFWTTTGLIIASIIFYVIEFFLNVLQCSPIEANWNKKIAGKCIGSNNILYTAAFNVISDIVILLLPLVRTWRLQMSIRRKIGVLLLFSTGLLAVATSALRLYYSDVVLYTSDKSYNYLIFGFCLWSELVAGVIVGCMPTLPKFTAAVKDSMISSRSRLLSSKYFWDMKTDRLGHVESGSNSGGSHRQLKSRAISLENSSAEELDDIHIQHL